MTMPKNDFIFFIRLPQGLEQNTIKEFEFNDLVCDI
jgi:hypothetical protein